MNTLKQDWTSAHWNARTLCRWGSTHTFEVRLALKCETYQRGAPETRGRKRVLTSTMVHKMDEARKKLLQRTDNDREVRWEDSSRGTLPFPPLVYGPGPEPRGGFRILRAGGPGAGPGAEAQGPGPESWHIRSGVRGGAAAPLWV